MTDIQLARPSFISFDIYGTVLNWFDGLSESLKAHDVKLNRRLFDQIIDLQGRAQQRTFRCYSEITAESLCEVVGLSQAAADEIARNCGKWPLFKDSLKGMESLMKIAPCAALTNSDLAHGDQIQSQFGFKLSRWYCAEQLKIYKPNRRFWETVSNCENMLASRKWWHVSAYADYDLDVAADLGLTCVFVPRKHSRPGFAHVQADDLIALAALAESA
jgi:2-haloalkanoic acid dehalogenase type II